MIEPAKKFSMFNFILWGIIFFCLATILAIVIPNLLSASATGGGLPRPCLFNLRELDSAAKQFALENGKTNGSLINFPDDLTPYIKLNNAGKIPPCPAGGVYNLSKVGGPPICSLGTTIIPAHVLP